jgi:hypothetical protein
VLEERKVGVYVEICLTRLDKDGDLQDGIRVKVG